MTWPDLSTQAWIAIAYTFLVGAIGGWLTEISPWYRALREPSWKPPDWAFGPGWTVILSLACYAAIRGWEALDPGPGRWLVMLGFVANGVLNGLWSLLFFRCRRPDWALREVVFLWLSVIVLIAALSPVSATAALCLVPYALWVIFAGALNRAVVRLNGPFGRAPGLPT